MLGYCCGEERGRENENGEHGRERADAGVLKPRSGASWPARSGRWRRAAVAADTRRAGSAGDRPLTMSIQFVSNEVPSLTMCFTIELTP